MSSKTTVRTHLISRYSVPTFFILAMALGAGVIYLVVRGVFPAQFALVSVLSVSIAGVIVTALEDGKASLKLMLGRLLIWRVGIGYWLFATLFVVPVYLAGSAFNPLFGGDPLTLTDLKPGMDFLLMFVAFTIIAGLGQELGWTGFLTPRLQARYSALAASVIRAVMVSLWHLPLLLYSRFQFPALADFPYGGWIAGYGFLAAAGMLLTFSFSWSVFFTWMFNNTGGSLLLVAVLHGSEVWVAYMMLKTGIDPSNLANYWGYGAMMIFTAIVIVLITGPKNLSRKHTRIVCNELWVRNSSFR